jgi:pyruvate,orthophosphate dikinase
MTSHAAVVARGMGKCCVAGAGAIQVDDKALRMTVGKLVLQEGDWVSLDGSTGRVIQGQVPTMEPDPSSGEFAKFMSWADGFRKLGVRANADIPRDAAVARKFGAQGIGLCRTEHMFFAADRIRHMQAMILAETEKDRRKALAKLLPMQRKDFIGLFRVMEGLPVIIRLLDPPLHEFLPKREELMVEIALLKQKSPKSRSVKEKEKLLARVEQLHELNPMLGLRGCRLGIVHPEISEMQARAIIEAACQVAKEGKSVIPEIMIPLVGSRKELALQKEIVDRVAGEVFAKNGTKVRYMVGTMIELPRAALVADEIAKEAEFFSFGTNDLTQTTYGFSRDDSGKFLEAYTKQGVLEHDPFAVLDRAGVGQLIQITKERGRKANPKLEVGICGEHGGDPSSVEFCHQVGLDYVSCSPYRVPIARLAAAQAALGDTGEEMKRTA